MHLREPLTRRVWETVFLRTLTMSLISVFVSVVVSHVLLETFSQGLGAAGLFAAIVAPLMLGSPMVFYFSLKHQQLQSAYRQLELAAARDSLTQCLNHGAFVAGTNSVLEAAPHEGGALLVIDADHFKSINDRFGHETGDAALKAIASAIRRGVRVGDLVGRMGGEEFAVLLHGANMTGAHGIAETIRLNVRHLNFSFQHEPVPLSVSIGGVVYDTPQGFGNLFRIADRRLYEVKNSGRDRIALADLEADWEEGPGDLAKAV